MTEYFLAKDIAHIFNEVISTGSRIDDADFENELEEIIQSYKTACFPQTQT